MCINELTSQSEQTMRSLEPIIPAPSGKYTGIPDYIAHVIQMAGSARAVAQAIGIKGGTRISDYRNAHGVPGVLMALRLARFSGDDPVDVLVMSGHQDIVDELNKVWGKPAEPSAVHLAKMETGMKVDELILALQRVARAAKEDV
jgi:hypothetical protein